MLRFGTRSRARAETALSVRRRQLPAARGLAALPVWKIQAVLVNRAGDFCKSRKLLLIARDVAARLCTSRLQRTAPPFPAAPNERPRPVAPLVPPRPAYWPLALVAPAVFRLPFRCVPSQTFERDGVPEVGELLPQIARLGLFCLLFPKCCDSG
jgi:hypothetical protein